MPTWAYIQLFKHEKYSGWLYDFKYEFKGINKNVKFIHCCCCC